jgi:hypothetical protein
VASDEVEPRERIITRTDLINKIIGWINREASFCDLSLIAKDFLPGCETCESLEGKFLFRREDTT